MNLIVCGDALWISCGTWIAFWNGAIGAFVAAFVGGLVALGVVRLTNNHQSKLASSAREREAAAEMAAALSSMTKKYVAGKQTITELYAVAQAASLRWQMELTNDDMEFEIDRWPHHVGMLAFEVINQKGNPEAEDEAFDRLSDAASAIEVFVVDWAKASDHERDHHLLPELHEDRKRTEKPSPKPESTEPAGSN
ncbi:hypothetical protein [Pseudarthrobacter sp. LT1]|uniref:hypothetical protein n=1 Tax=Pseudarthrobacter sp. LT1 TaxID=3111450 RepID=UPI002D776A22|nr:hypothetical protein [Pseudarthrobacter sp. LT1]WRT14681.1 hypothetical protein VIK36_04080 [Pseudarthrobacter sp. LT1]